MHALIGTTTSAPGLSSFASTAREKIRQITSDVTGSLHHVDRELAVFLEAQKRECGCRQSVGDGLWALFAILSVDADGNALARALLRDTPFTWESGESEDNAWTLYYVDNANRTSALHWIEDLIALCTGRLRPTAPTHLGLIAEMPASDMPHRIAQRLVDLLHAEEIAPSAIADPALLRMMLDRLHSREPLHFSAFHLVLSHHLVDMVQLQKQLIDEDVALFVSMLQGSVSQNPFYQTRQTAAANIHRELVFFQLINPLDQLRNTAAINPYAAYMEITLDGDTIMAPMDGSTCRLECRHFIDAIRSIRRNLYRGEQFDNLNTHSPWMTEAIALPFRFIKQRIASKPDVTPMVALALLERAASPS